MISSSVPVRMRRDFTAWDEAFILMSEIYGFCHFFICDSGSSVVTVSASNITFKKPVKVGDVVCCYGECVKIGRTSMSINLEVWVKPIKKNGRHHHFQVCDATFNYVAIDEKGKPLPIQKDV